MSLCKYKDIFGKPGEGAHQYRIFDIAIVDTVLTVLLAFVIAYFSGVSLVYVVPFTAYSASAPQLINCCFPTPKYFKQVI